MTKNLHHYLVVSAILISPSKDILTIPPAEILTTKVLFTVMGGKDTFRATLP